MSRHQRRINEDEEEDDDEEKEFESDKRRNRKQQSGRKIEERRVTVESSDEDDDDNNDNKVINNNLINSDDEISSSSDPYSLLYESIEARLSLTSRAILVLTKILIEWKKQHPIQSDSLIESLKESLNDANMTHEELTLLHNKFIKLKLDRSWSSRKRRKRKLLRQRLTADFNDITTRFTQIRQLANQKLYYYKQHNLATSKEINTQFPPVVSSSNNSNNSIPSPLHSNVKQYYQRENGKHQEMKEISPSLKSSSSSPSYHSYQSSTDDNESLTSLTDNDHATSNSLIFDSSSLSYAEEDAEVNLSFMKEIEHDVEVVHGMFIDLHDLVHQQGEVVSSIESNIQTTSLKTRQAVDEIFKAEAYMKKKRERV